MDVLSHIKKEHDDFKKKMEAIESASGQQKQALFKELYAELHGHHEAEEHVLFPKVKENSKDEDKEVVREMIEEHSLGSYQFSLIDRTSLSNETWDAKFSVLKEVLTHHMDEEEDSFFELAKKVIAQAELSAVLDEFESTHKQYTEKKKKELN